MAEANVSHPVPCVKEHALNFVEREGEIYFSSEEIGRHLGFKNPSKSINVLFSRKQKELSSYATGIKLMQVDGCLREVRCFTEEGVYILSMLAQTPQARDFRARLARLLRELREHRLTLAREAGYAQGLDAARALPAVQAERQAGYLAGLKEGQRLWQRSHGPRALKRLIELRTKGLTWREVGKCLGISDNAARKRYQSARKAGLGV